MGGIIPEKGARFLFLAAEIARKRAQKSVRRVTEK
jgi:hypothetical protein